VNTHKHFVLFDAFRGVVWNGYDSVVFIKDSDHATFEAAGAVFRGLGVTNTSEIKCVYFRK
jgi:hypothetical protein